jgi:hypothetical protein
VLGALKATLLFQPPQTGPLVGTGEIEGIQVPLEPDQDYLIVTVDEGSIHRRQGISNLVARSGAARCRKPRPAEVDSRYRHRGRGQRKGIPEKVPSSGQGAALAW